MSCRTQARREHATDVQYSLERQFRPGQRYMRLSGPFGLSEALARLARLEAAGVPRNGAISGVRVVNAAGDVIKQGELRRVS